MVATGPAAGSAGTSPEGAGDEARLSLLQLLKGLAADLPGLLSDRIHLAALELKRARQALLQMAMLVVLAAIFAATAWLALWAFLVALALSAGVSLPLALAGALVLNAAGGAFALKKAMSLVDLLTLPATLRRLTLTPAPEPGPEPDPAPTSAASAAAAAEPTPAPLGGGSR